MTRKLITSVVALLLATTAFFGRAEEQKREYRAVWFTTVSNIDWPGNRGTSNAIAEVQKQQMLDYLDIFEATNINVVCFQVRSMCDAMYDSSYEPWSSYLTGSRGAIPAWDPLEFIVEECHKRGMELHCWVNPYRFANGSASTWNTAPDNQLKSDGLLLSYTNSSGTTTTILNPALPAARQRIVNVCEDLINKYNIDGIIFDDYFYPNGMPTTSDQPDYDLYVRSYSSLSFAEWRRENVNRMVRDVYNMIQSKRPEVRFGIGPAGVAGTKSTSADKYGVTPCPKGSDWQYNGIFSDPLAWLNDGAIDYISPQLYWKTNHSTNPFGPLTKWWSYCANHFGRHHYASHSISFLASSNTEADWSEIAEQIRLSRQYNEDNAPGFNFFSARYISGPTASGLGDYLVSTILPTKALPPALTWKSAIDLGAPEGLNKQSNRLSWLTVDATLAKYAVYAVPEGTPLENAQSATFGGIKSDYLLGVTYNGYYDLPNDKTTGYWYAVTILDGYNNEYAPAILGIPVDPAPVVTLISPINDALVEWSQSFAWSEAEQATFRLQISSDSNFSDLVVNQKDLTENEVTVDLLPLESNTRYYWRVITTVAGMLESKSETGTFMTGNHPAAPAPILVAPANGLSTDEDFRFQVQKNSDIESFILQVASDSEFGNIVIESTLTEGADGYMGRDCAIAGLGIGTFYWRVISKISYYNDGISETRHFTITDIPTGNYEPGYVVKLDKDNDSYTMTDGMLFTNNWIRSVMSPYENISWESSGSYNRSMTALNGRVYVTGRSENSSTASCYLRVFDITHGEHLNDILLPDAVQASYFPVNDVMTDDAGHLLVSNLTLNVSTAPLLLYQVDVETGEVEERACLYGESKARLDHCVVTGDVEAGNFVVYAPVSRDNRILRWTFTDGEETDFDDITLWDFYPDNYYDLGTAPRVFPLGYDDVIVNSSQSKLARYNLAEGTITDSFDNNNDLVPVSNNANGVAAFSFRDRQYLLYAYSDYSSNGGYRFMLAGTPDNAALQYSAMSPLWTFPLNGIGAVNSTTFSAPCCALVEENEVKIFVFSAGNGLACYTLSPYRAPLDGDVNNDGVVNAGDISTVYAVMLGSETDADIIARADVNGDGAVNAGDISTIYGIILQ